MRVRNAEAGFSETTQFDERSNRDESLHPE